MTAGRRGALSSGDRPDFAKEDLTVPKPRVDEDDEEDNDNDNNNDKKGEDMLSISDLNDDDVEELSVTDLDLDDPLDVNELMQLDFKTIKP